MPPHAHTKSTQSGRLRACPAGTLGPCAGRIRAKRPPHPSAMPPRPIETQAAFFRPPLRSKPHRQTKPHGPRAARNPAAGRAEEMRKRKRETTFRLLLLLNTVLPPFLFLYAEKKERGFSFTLSAPNKACLVDVYQYSMRYAPDNACVLLKLVAEYKHPKRKRASANT